MKEVDYLVHPDKREREQEVCPTQPPMHRCWALHCIWAPCTDKLFWWQAADHAAAKAKQCMTAAEAAEARLREERQARHFKIQM